MVELRAYRPGDLDSLYDICLRTADYGEDMSGQHNDPKAVGHIYAGPYGVLEPERVLVAEDEKGVAGYILGTFDTDAFERRMAREWWPKLQEHYASVAPEALTPADRNRIDAILQPSRDPPDIVARYPAHIHLDLLPRIRGQRVGTALLQRWIGAARDAGVPGIHLGANTNNTGGIAFGPAADLNRL